MKLQIPRILLLASLLASSSLFTACVSSPYRDVRHYPSSETQYMTYSSLPTDFSGDAYYYNNRYYAGGRYEPGTYTYGGRTYDHRYYHNGQYIYGGQYRQQSSPRSYSSVGLGATTSGGYLTYRSLPRNYSGDAYYYNNLYYAGGRYERGAYTYGGRTYDHRYYHNGNYIYGGEYRRQSAMSRPISSRRYSPAYRSSRRYVSY